MDINESLKSELREEKTILQDLTEQLKKMNMYLNENEKRVIETLRRKVTKFGNSAHIPVPVRFIGADTIVKILQDNSKIKNEGEKQK